MTKRKSVVQVLIGLLLVAALVLVPMACKAPEAPPAAPPEEVAPPPVEYPLGKAVIKLGGMDIMSGMHADYGRQMLMGAQMAIEEINAAGGILGSQLELKFRDSRFDPDASLENGRYFVEEWGADFLFGLSAEGGIDSMAPHLPGWGVLLMVCHSAAPRINEKTVYEGLPGGDHVFRITQPFYQDAILSALYFSEWPEIKTWAILSADYEYGWTVRDLFKESMEKHRPDVEFVGEAAAGWATADFTSQIAALMAKEPNLIVCVPWAGEGVSALRQAVVAGLFDQDWFKAWFQCMGGSVDLAEGISDDVAAGKFNDKLWATARYLWNQSDRPQNVKFVNDFRERFGDRYPNYSAPATYTAIYAFKQAVEETRSLDAEKLIKALEGMTIEAPEGPRWFRPEDHQACYTTPLGRYTFDRSVAPIAFLDPATFSDIPWEDYYRNPPDYATP